MRRYLGDILSTIPGVEFYDDGDNIYVQKGVGPYPCIVAHMDTVHDIVADLTAVVVAGKITGINAKTMRQTGIGGDDKVGIYVALEMPREHDNMKVFFARDEEVGCDGSQLANPLFFDDVTIALQCDRRGNSDFVTEVCGTKLSSSAFQKAVLPIISRYGYKFSKGLMTDVMELKQMGILPSMANISCGYYNPHSADEYVDIGDVERVVRMVSDIITNLGTKSFPHDEPIPKWKKQDAYNWWDDEPARILGRDMYCQDCRQMPSTKGDNLCDDCRDWYNMMYSKETRKKYVKK